jgi:hypothetical protein
MYVHHESHDSNVATGMPPVALRLLLCHLEHVVMTVERVWAVVLAVAMLSGVSMVWTRESIQRLPPAVAQPTSQTTTVIDSRARALPTRDDGWAEPRVDLNGNEIDAAVSDYRVDGRGELYERHAPDTALLHLSAPEL